MIAILLSTYNGEKYLECQIESIVNQTFKKWNLYIRDDGSQDHTIDIIDKYTSLYPKQIFRYKDTLGNIGYKKSFMELLANIDADYYMFCDQDDYWMNNKLECFYRYMIDFEKKYVYCPILLVFDMIITDSSLNVISNSFHRYNRSPYKYVKNTYCLLNYPVAYGCSMIFNKYLKQISLPYKGVFPHDMWLALISSRMGVIEYIDESYMLYRRHSKNVTKSNGATSTNIICNIILNFPLKIKNILYYCNGAKEKLPFEISTFFFFYWRIRLFIFRLFY